MPLDDDLNAVKQDILLFLRLAEMCANDGPRKLPLGLSHRAARIAIEWLRGLAERYSAGEDISKSRK